MKRPDLAELMHPIHEGEPAGILKDWISKQPEFAPSAADIFAKWFCDLPEFAPAVAANRLDHKQVVRAAIHCARLSLEALFVNQLFYNESIENGQKTKPVKIRPVACCLKTRELIYAREPKPHIADTVVIANLDFISKYAIGNRRLTTSLRKRVFEKFMDTFWPTRPHPGIKGKRRASPTRMVFDHVRDEIDSNARRARRTPK
jgi:hypothetical protein